MEWILTQSDDQDIYVENITLTEKELQVPGITVIKKRLRGGLRDGVDVIEVQNKDGLSFHVVPTRGMGIWKGEYKGMKLGWNSPAGPGPIHPQFVNLESRGRLGWLNGFDEWIVRCGLDSNGAASDDTVLDNQGNPKTVSLNLHGRIANIPAHFVSVISDPANKKVSIMGSVKESSLFCPMFSLHSTISISSGDNTLHITDQVTNLKSSPAEMQLLYHINFGEPLLEAGSRFIAPIKEMCPRDQRAMEDSGVSQASTYLPPTTGYVEQVYFYDLHATDRNETIAALLNREGDKCAAIRFDASTMRSFSLWKNTQNTKDGYVTGLEPGTNYPNPKVFERSKGRVVSIQPGETYTTELHIEIHNTKLGVQKVEAEIEAIQKEQGPAQIHLNPVSKFSNAV